MIKKIGTKSLYISRDLGSKNCFISTEEPMAHNGRWILDSPSMDSFTYISNKMLERLGISLEEGTMAKVFMHTSTVKVDLNGKFVRVD